MRLCRNERCTCYGDGPEIRVKLTDAQAAHLEATGIPERPLGRDEGFLAAAWEKGEGAVLVLPSRNAALGARHAVLAQANLAADRAERGHPECDPEPEARRWHRAAARALGNLAGRLLEAGEGLEQGALRPKRPPGGSRGPGRPAGNGPEGGP